MKPYTGPPSELERLAHEVLLRPLLEELYILLRPIPIKVRPPAPVPGVRMWKDDE